MKIELWIMRLILCAMLIATLYLLRSAWSAGFKLGFVVAQQSRQGDCRLQ